LVLSARHVRAFFRLNRVADLELRQLFTFEYVTYVTARTENELELHGEGFMQASLTWIVIGNLRDQIAGLFLPCKESGTYSPQFLDAVHSIRPAVLLRKLQQPGTCLETPRRGRKNPERRRHLHPESSWTFKAR
jgi:hypothetical protein